MLTTHFSVAAMLVGAISLAVGLAAGPGNPTSAASRLPGEGEMHGTDVDDRGNGTVSDQRLYQLVRQTKGGVADHEFQIEFLEPGVQGAFTFG